MQNAKEKKGAKQTRYSCACTKITMIKERERETVQETKTESCTHARSFATNSHHRRKRTREEIHTKKMKAPARLPLQPFHSTAAFLFYVVAGYGIESGARKKKKEENSNNTRVKQ